MTDEVEKEKNQPMDKRVVRKTLKLLVWTLLRFGRWYIPNVPEIKPEMLLERLNSKESNESILLIDVRDNAEIEKDGCIEGSTFFPYFNFPSHIHEIPRDPEPEIITICPGGGASLVVAEILISEGFKNVKSLKGGFRGWRKKKYPITNVTVNQLPDTLTDATEEQKEFLQEKESLLIDEPDIKHRVDARNLSCPLPVLESKKAIKKMKIGEILEILTTDPGSLRDIPAWAVNTKQELLSYNELEPKGYRFLVKRLK